MRTLQLPISQDHEEAAVRLKGQYPVALDAYEFLDRDTEVIAPDGHPVAVLLTQRIDPEMYRLALALWRPVNDPLSNRSTAMGVSSIAERKPDGTLSPRRCVHRDVLAVLKKQGAAQGILGWDVERGRKSRLTIQCPEMRDGNKRLINEWTSC